jgi:hypothetical protein
MPYALDNGAYKAFTGGKPFDSGAFFNLCDWAKASGVAPRWVLVPDVVAEPKATLYAWDHYWLRCQEYGWPIAFAAQDGHTIHDVPVNADVVFIGGTTEWKRKNIYRFSSVHQRVHVGRINTYKWLSVCSRAGCESVDGTGYFRGDKQQLGHLIDFLEEQRGTHRHPVQAHMFTQKRNSATDCDGVDAN